MGFCKLNNYALRVVGADLHICISKGITYDYMFLIFKYVLFNAALYMFCSEREIYLLKWLINKLNNIFVYL